jgi:hypothetical protein
MLFYNGQVDCEPFYVKNGSNAANIVNQFPYFDNYNVVTGSFPTTNSDSLLFYNENAVYGQVPNDSLYTKYWETYVELLYNPRTRLINASAIIPLADYFKMELNDIVDFRGNYYHLRAINDYNLSNGECKLQLLGPIIADSLETIRDSYSFCLGYNESNCDLACDDSANCYTTTTTTLSYRAWQVGGAEGVGDCNICLTCEDNLRTIYTAASVTELALNVFVYTNPALTTPVPQGWFSDCVKGWAVGTGANAGRIVSGVSSCSLCTTTTTTSTTTTSTTSTSTSTTSTTTIAPTPSPLIQNGLVFHLSCDSYNVGSPGVWNDKSGKGNNATVTGPPLIQSGSAGLKFAVGRGSNTNRVVWNNPLNAEPSSSYTIQWRGTFDSKPGTFPIYNQPRLFTKPPATSTQQGFNTLFDWRTNSKNLIYDNVAPPPSSSGAGLHIPQYVSGSTALFSIVVANAGTPSSTLSFYNNTIGGTYGTFPTSPFNTSTQPLQFGPGDNYTLGEITDLVCYNRALSSAEIISNYNQLTSSCL